METYVARSREYRISQVSRAHAGAAGPCATVRLVEDGPSVHWRCGCGVLMRAAIDRSQTPMTVAIPAGEWERAHGVV